MQFVQRQVFTNDGLSKGIIAVLGANGVRAVRKALDESPSKDQIINLFRKVIDDEYIDLDTFDGYSSTNTISFMSIHRALRQMDTFKVDAPLSVDVKYRKLYMLLESLEFMEADIYLRLLMKRFDVKSVESVVFPEREVEKTPRKSRKADKVAEEKLIEADNENPTTDLLSGLE